MDFVAFARAHGVLIRDLWSDGRIHRVPTSEKPRARNGAYRFDGEWGWVQAWDTMPQPAIYRPQRPQAAPIAPRRYQPAPDELQARQRAEKAAREIVERCRFDTHAYLTRKGFPVHRALVDADGRLVVPMRSMAQYERIQSVQWIAEDGSKRFLPGGAAKDAVFRIGAGSDTWLCEGYATGLSVSQALRSLYWPATVVVCFSAGNLAHVARGLRGRVYVMADNDASGTGQRTAEQTGLRWVMPPTEGTDANDMHLEQGLRALAELIREARTQ